METHRTCGCQRSRAFELEGLGPFDEFDELEGEAELDALDGGFEGDAFVFDTDNRFPIRHQTRAPSTRQFPWTTICQILTSRGGLCSGTLISPRVVLTAKHCLFANPGRPACGPMISGPATVAGGAVRVFPGRHLNQTSAQPSSIAAPASRQFGHPQVDIGLIVLPQAFRRPSQFMLLQPRGDAETVGRVVTLAGYPGDMPSNTMWAHSDRVLRVSRTHLIYHIDLCPGQSGGPVWMLGQGQTRILLGVQSVHTQSGVPPGQTNCGTRISGTPIHNCGVRLTCDVIRWILDVCRRQRVRPPAVDRPTMQRCPSKATRPVFA